MSKKRLTINGLIDAAQKGSGISSDYGIAKRLGVARQNVGRWRRTNCIGDENIIALAELAGLDSAVIVAQIQEDRAQVDDVKRFWRDVQKRLKAGQVTASLMFAGTLLATGGNVPGYYILC